MTAIDVGIIGFVVLLAGIGYFQGVIVGALSLVGFAAGAFAGTRIGPLLLHGGAASPYAPLFGLGGALLGGAILAGGLEGLGLSLRRRLRPRAVRAVDGVLGALLTGCVGFGIAWIGGAIALQTPGSGGLRRAIQRSTVLGALNSVLPPSGAILHAIARFDPLRALPGSEPRVAPPAGAILGSPGVSVARASVVRVLGTSCGLAVEGSGWVGAPGVVVTAAHVVAGETDAVVEADGVSPRLPARAIWFDSKNDIALLRVTGLTRRRLPLVESPVGTSVALLGFPLNGPFDARPARLGPTQVTLFQDVYGKGPVPQRIESFRGRVRAGNSGGPLVDGAGNVAGTVFAALVRVQGGYAVPDGILRDALRRAGPTVGTGPCGG